MRKKQKNIMAAPVTQALVLVGGKASRLKQGGVDVPLSKSFLNIADKPLLFWNLSSLYLAGIRSVVIAGNMVQHLHKAHAVLRMLPYRFREVTFFHDLGLGVHGLPYEARYLLEETFIFECGHGLSTTHHYQLLMGAKNKNNVVFSAFTPHPNNPRQPIIINSSGIRLDYTKRADHAALAHPIIADQAYAQQLLTLNFNINDILAHYAQLGQLQYVWSTLPPEFDIAEELAVAQMAYETFLENNCYYQ